MADVTINQLDSGIPNKNSAIIPYSDGTTTLKTSPSGIVAASPGSTLQVVQAVYNAFQFYSTSTSFTNTGIEASITPKSSNSRIRIDFTSQFATRESDGSVGYTFGAWNITRNNTELVIWGNAQYLGWSPGGVQYIDSPNTSSPLTYRIQVKKNGGNGGIYTGWGSSVTSSASIIILTEIAG